MKGGITSGVIYPSAACELAKTYNFKNIGGTSAGAIAAAATAAAECGRRNGKGTGFGGFAGLPDWIGKPGRLMKMFQPDPKTRALFQLATELTKRRNPVAKAFCLFKQLVRHFPLTTFALGALVLSIRYFVLNEAHGFLLVYSFTATILLALLIFLAVALAFLARQITHTVPENFYGLSKAYDPRADPANAEAPLTNWLTRFLNELAGKAPSDGPLTFGDLYRAQRTASDPEPAAPEYQAIRLEMMTTALNHGRPYRLPFRDPDRVFYFCPDEFSNLFPPMVVKHMVDHAPESQGPAPHAPGCKELLRFPDAEDLPLVVATRMSLSFPLLLAAVPLYAIDFTLAENSDKNKPRRAERCWFSDGGISSNLPIHFFDSALPQWPTFAIDLKQFHPDHPDEKGAVWMPDNPNSGWLALWNRFEEPGKFGSITDFLAAILNAMQNWQDNTQARVPGYRDRVVHVCQHEDEGGLNLDMPQDVVKRLASRGQRAGTMLAARFAAGGGWTEHRWVRFRSCMALTEVWLREIAEAYPDALPPDSVLEEILLRPPGAPPTVYHLTAADQQRAKSAMATLLQLWQTWSADGTGFQSAPPHPLPELRIKAKV